MTVRIQKPAFNIREKLSELDFGHVPYEKMPAGSVIQVVRINSATDTSVSGASASSNWNAIAATSGVIYPKYQNSYLLYCCSVGAEHDGASTTNTYGFLKLFRNDANAGFTNALTESRMFFTEGTDDHGATTTTTMVYLDVHNQPPGTRVEYKIYYNKRNNTSATHFNQKIQSVDGTTDYYSNGYIMEIVQ